MTAFLTSTNRYYAEVSNRVGQTTYPSARLPFTIAVPPAPVLSSVTLPSGAARLVAGATGVLTLSGSSFSTTALDGSPGGAIVSVNGQNGLWTVTSRTASSLTVQLPASVAAGTYTLQVINADAQQSVSTVQVVVVPPLAVSSSSPATIFVEEQTTVSLAGTFRAGATVVNAPNLAGAPALSVSDNAISFGVNIPGANAPSSYTITLSEPTTYGQSAITRTIPVQFPLPALTSLTPDELDASPASGGVASTITIAGTGFTSRTSVFAGTRDLSSFITSRSATSLTLNFPVGTFPAPEVVQIRAENPGAQGSGTLPLTIKNVAPVLSIISPQPLVAIQDQQITITGSKFFNATVTQVFAGSGANAVALSGATVTPTSITVNVPAARVPDIGTLAIEVRNTFGTDVQTSESQNIRIIHPTPEITSLAPLTIPAFDNAQTLTINGAKFAAAPMVQTRSRVVWIKNGVETVLTLLPNPTATQLRATIPASLLTELGSVTIRVQNQDALDADGGPSASSPLTIIPPIPVVTSVAPNSATASVNAIPVVVTGSKFVQSGLRLVIRNPQTGLVRNLNSPTFGNATTVSGIIPADIAAMAGNYTLAVVNGANAQGQGGGESATTLPFTILNPAPSIASVAPNPATVYEAFTLDVLGSGFVSGATSVTVDGQTFTPANVTVISPTRLTVNVTAIGTAKTANVSITNPQLSVGASLQGGGTATTTFPVVPPVPTVSSAQGNGGGGTLTRNLAGTLTVTGTGFVAGATVLFAGQALATTFTNQNTLTATVPAALLPTHGVYTVAVRNPQFGGQGGGTSSPEVGVTVQNPTPTLSTIAPTSVTRGNNASITLTGSNFYDGAVAYLSGASSSTFATVFVNSGSLSLSIPASSLPVAGTYSIAVKNSDPTPGFSGTKTLTVNNPAPVLTALSVNESEAFANDVTITVTGSGFESGIAAYWTPSGGNPTGSRQALAAPIGVSAGSCTITIPAALLTQAGAFTITLENAAPSLGASNPLTFTVLDRVPTLTSVAPNPIEALSGNTQITLTGDYFAPTANAFWNGVLLTRVSVNRTSLVATVPASRLTLATVAQITVQNPQFSGRGGGTSIPAQDLVITNPAPALTSLSPTFVLAGASTASILLTGTAFMPGAPMVQGSVVEMSVAGGAFAQVPATYQSATRMVLTLPAPQLEQPTILAFRVVSPKVNGLGGGTTVEKIFVVRPPDPTLTSITPTTATLTNAPTTVDISLKGTGFVTNSTVQIAGVNTTTTYVSATELRISLDIGVGVRPAGTYSLRILTPPIDVAGTPQGGGTSGALNFTVLNGLPKLTTLAPSTTSASLSAWTLTLTGENFATTSRVNYNGTLVAVGNVDFISPTELRATLPAPPIASTTHTVRVENPPIGGQGGGTSATLSLTIEFPRPLLTSLSDYSTSATLSDWTMLIRGQLFAPLATVTLNGTPITASVVNSTTIRAIIPAAATRAATYYTLTVSNPTPGGGATSASFAVTNPSPTLSGITPPTVAAGATQTFTLTGTNFVTNSTVVIDGGAIQATTLASVNFLIATSLTVSVPGWLISTRGTYSLRVVNPAPGGGLSGTRAFTVTTGTVASAEFIGVTTAVLAGSADGFAVRFPDSFGNLTDFPAPFVRFTDETGSSTGTIPLSRNSLGTSSATATTYTIDGNYRLWIDGISSTTGNASFVVNANNDARVEISGVPNRLQAGEMLPALSVKYFDKFNNPTDRNVGAVTLRYSTSGIIRHTLGVVRLSEGVYQTLPYTLTLADTYYVQISGINQANTRYTSSTGTLVVGALPFVEVTPSAAVLATLSGVDIDINAGQTQTNARVRSYDQYGNLSNVPTLTALTFSNATDASVRSSAGTLTLARTGFGLYDVDATKFVFAGNYTLTSPEVAQTGGGRFFAVRALSAVSAVVNGVSPVIAAGGVLPPFTIQYKDRYGNGVNATNQVSYSNSTATVTGVFQTDNLALGTVRTLPTRFVSEGAYTVAIAGLSAAAVSGNRSFQVMPQAPAPCGSISIPDEEADPATLARRNQQRQVLLALIQEISTQRKGAKLSADEQITIPVVVHVISTKRMRDENVNISDDDIAQQIAILNRDFQAQNADIADVIDVFKNVVGGSVNIRFVLAKRDPQGFLTSGINRFTTDLPQFAFPCIDDFCRSRFLDIYRIAPGWNPDKYLNVWVTNLGRQFGIAVANFPDSPRTQKDGNDDVVVDGILFDYPLWGNLGNYVNRDFNSLGRTLTYEVGHWLSLYHIWGNGNCGNDEVDDTPIQPGPINTCPVNRGNLFYTLFGSPSICVSSPPNLVSHMYQNHMDYTPDPCRVMFSQGQVLRMQSVVSSVGNMQGLRYSITQSDGAIRGREWGYIDGQTIIRPGIRALYYAFIDIPSATVINYQWEASYQDQNDQWSAFITLTSAPDALGLDVLMPTTAKRIRLRIKVSTSDRGESYIYLPNQAEILNANLFPYFVNNLALAPNPVSDQASLSFDLTITARVRAEVYNALNQSVITVLPETQQSAGQQDIGFSTASLASGTYRVRVMANDMNGAVQY